MGNYLGYNLLEFIMNIRSLRELIQQFLPGNPIPDAKRVDKLTPIALVEYSMYLGPLKEILNDPEHLSHTKAKDLIQKYINTKHK